MPRLAGAGSTFVVVGALVTAVAACRGGYGGGAAEASPQRLPCDPARRSIKLTPPKRGVYFGAYLDDTLEADFLGKQAEHLRRSLPRFASLAGKRPAWLSVFHLWPDGKIEFPTELVRSVWESGAMPTFALMPARGFDDKPDPLFSMQSFIDGRHDEALRGWARAAKASGVPMLLHFGGEVTAGWPWSAANNGGGETNGYGDPSLPDGAERYRDAHRHVVDLFRQEGADNVTWNFHATPPPAGARDPEWNDVTYYYPGDEHVDWISSGVWGYFPPYFTRWQSFAQAANRAYRQMSRVSKTKPMMFYDTAAARDRRHPERHARWIADGLRQLRQGSWPRVKGFGWWNERSDYGGAAGITDARINSSPVALRAFRDALASPFFEDALRFRCG